VLGLVVSLLCYSRICSSFISSFILCLVAVETTSPSKVNDDVNNFKQYPGESLLETCFTMLEIHILRSFYSGLGTWNKTS
jgi:hypothetical protein